MPRCYFISKQSRCYPRRAALPVLVGVPYAPRAFHASAGPRAAVFVHFFLLA